ncbi:MAG: TetR/AcrR family transcriptional regulator [Rhodospirillales bacterium]|nr:TetR/AcrR family transcriptional regulator [Rhodospirillales bacterium]
MTDLDPNVSSRGEARRRAMMDAAWATVLEKGFAAITLADIITRSGGSKSTLYTTFGDKDGLLRAVMQEKCDAFSGELSLTLDADQPPKVTLHRFGALFADKLTEDEVIRFSHLILAEGHLFPALLEGFICGGPQRTQQRLTRYLEDVAKASKLTIEDPAQAADLLLSMLMGRWTETMQSHAFVGADLAVYKQQVHKRTRAAIDLFLAATQP